MGLFSSQFFDPQGNFDNRLIVRLMNNAKRKQIRAQARKKKKSTFEDFNSIMFGGIGKKDVWMFINKLANFLNGGVDLKSAVSMLYRQIRNPQLKNIIGSIKINLEYGLSVAETLRQYQQYFDPLIISLLDIGERTGTLPKILLELDERLLEEIEIRRRINGAMIYPIILVFLTLTMVIGMMVYIIPKIATVFTTAHTELPALTRYVIAVSDFFRNDWYWIIGGIVSIIALYFGLKMTTWGKTFYGHIALKMPVFGYINRTSNVVLFINSLALLIESGVLMIPAMEITAGIVPNILFKRDVIRIKNEMETGIKLSTAMGMTHSESESNFYNPFFPEDLVQMVFVGEETGTISRSITRIGKNYQKDLRNYIGNIMTMLEPFILVFVGTLVGIIVIAIMLPFFNIGKVIQHT